MARDARSGDVRVAKVDGEKDLACALAIREVVFIEEQHVPVGLERDDQDASAYHVLAFQAGHAVGTGRLVRLPSPPAGESGSWAQIGRMAVLAANRGRGVGGALLDALEAEASRQGVRGIVLHAQLHAREFYVRRGYRDASPIFDEAGMPHVEMRKVLVPGG
jgi:predicted GNAT family N-acyltransferase